VRAEADHAAAAHPGGARVATAPHPAPDAPPPAGHDHSGGGGAPAATTDDACPAAPGTAPEPGNGTAPSWRQIIDAYQAAGGATAGRRAPDAERAADDGRDGSGPAVDDLHRVAVDIARQIGNGRPPSQRQFVAAFRGAGHSASDARLRSLYAAIAAEWPAGG